MDSIYKIKKSCYKSGELVPGCLFAWCVNSPFIRRYLGVDSHGCHVSCVIRSYNRDVSFTVENFDSICLDSAHIVVTR